MLQSVPFPRPQANWHSQGSKLLTLLLVLALFGNFPIFAEDSATKAAWKQDTQKAEKAAQKNEFTKAVEMYTAAVADAEKLGPDDARLADSLNHLASAHAVLGENAEAEAAVRRALALDEKRLGTNDYRLAEELLGLGAFCAAEGKYSESDGYTSRAQSLLEWQYGKYDRNVGVCILQRAKTAAMDGRLEDSEKLFKEALELIDSERTRFDFAVNAFPTLSIQAPDDSTVALALKDVSILYVKEKKFDEAEASLLRAVKIYSRLYGKKSLYLSPVLYDLSAVYGMEGKLDESRAISIRLLAILKKSGSKNPWVVNTRNLLDEVLHAKDKIETPLPPGEPDSVK